MENSAYLFFHNFFSYVILFPSLIKKKKTGELEALLSKLI